MMDLPLVTILCLARNHESFIEKALQSCIDQDYPSIEIIFFDNASEDKTFEKGAERLKQNNKPYQAIQSEHNIGIPAALNLIIKEKANGKYLCFNSGDDWMEPNNISEKINYIRDHKQYRWVYSYGYIYYDDTQKNELFNVERFKEGWVFEDLLKENFIPYQGTVFEKKIFEDIGFFDENTTIEDWDFSLRAVQRYPIGLVRKPLFYYRRHSSNYSASDNEKYLFDILCLTKKYIKHPNSKKAFEYWNDHYIRALYAKKPGWKTFFYILKYTRGNLFYFRTALSVLKKIVLSGK